MVTWNINIINGFDVNTTNRHRRLDALDLAQGFTEKNDC